jgi:hypothetical protein
MKELPAFRARKYDQVLAFVTQVFTHADNPEQSYLQRLIENRDSHYRAIFRLDYFTGATTPTKSQWNSLKKKLKRHDKQVFVFKEVGTIECEPNDTANHCGYVDFGFFAH